MSRSILKPQRNARIILPLAIWFGCSFASSSGAAVIDWQPGQGYFKASINGFYGIPGDAQLLTPTYLSSGFDDLVLDSGFESRSGFAAPYDYMAATSNTDWSLQLSAQGADVVFGVSSSMKFAGAASYCTLSEYVFVLDSPTDVRLELWSSGHWQVNPGVDYHAIEFSPRAFVSLGDGYNLFPDFDTPVAGALGETQTLPAGTYKFGATANLAGWDGGTSSWSESMHARLSFPGPLDVDGHGPRPEHPSLTMSPNPAAGARMVSVQLPEGAEIAIDLYDLGGRWIERIHHGYLPAGETRFPWAATGRKSGVFFARMVIGSRVITKRVVFLD